MYVVEKDVGHPTVWCHLISFDTREEAQAWMAEEKLEYPQDRLRVRYEDYGEDN